MGVTGLLFTFGFLAALALALFKEPRYGMYAYLAAFYVHPPSRWWGAALPDLRWSLLAAVVTLIAIWRRSSVEDRTPWFKTVPARLIIVFTVWVWIQNLWALDRNDHMDLSILYTKYILLFYLVYRLVDTQEEMGRFLLAHILGCFYLGYLAYGLPTHGRLEGVGGPGIDEANALAMQLATGVMCCAMFVLAERGWKRYVAVVAAAFMLNGIILCGSRGAFLAIIVGGIVLVLTKPREHRKLFYVLAVLGVTLFFMVANEGFWTRIGTMKSAVDETQEMDTSAESRFVIVEAQLKMAKRFPFGSGHRGTAALSREYLDAKYLTVNPDGTPGGRSSHNTFMSALVEQGIPGAAIFIGMLLWCRRAAKQLRQRGQMLNAKAVAYHAAILASLTVVFIAGMFVDYIATEVQIWMFALLAAACAGYRVSVPSETSALIVQTTSSAGKG